MKFQLLEYQKTNNKQMDNRTFSGELWKIIPILMKGKNVI